MNKLMALDLIDRQKNKLIDPVEMLHWTYLRTLIYLIPDDWWNKLNIQTDREISK